MKSIDENIQRNWELIQRGESHQFGDDFGDVENIHDAEGTLLLRDYCIVPDPYGDGEILMVFTRYTIPNHPNNLEDLESASLAYRLGHNRVLVLNPHLRGRVLDLSQIPPEDVTITIPNGSTVHQKLMEHASAIARDLATCNSSREDFGIPKINDDQGTGDREFSDDIVVKLAEQILRIPAVSRYILDGLMTSLSNEDWDSITGDLEFSLSDSEKDEVRAVIAKQ